MAAKNKNPNAIDYTVAKAIQNVGQQRLIPTLRAIREQVQDSTVPRDARALNMIDELIRKIEAQEIIE